LFFQKNVVETGRIIATTHSPLFLMPDTRRPDIKCVAFDMDGLMFSTEDVYWETASIMLQRRGHEYNLEIANDLMGRPPKYGFEKMIEYYGLDEDWETLHAESDETFIGLLDKGFTMMPGLPELLDRIESQGIPKAVCTSSSRRVAREVLGRSGVLKGMQFVLAFEDVVNGKPAPEIYLKAAQKFGVHPDRMLVLEDSVSGCHAARSAGAFTIAVLAEHNRTLDFSHASQVAQRLDAPEILELLGS